MDVDALIMEISAKDVDIEYFSRLVCGDPCARDTVIQHMLTNLDIMAYYHCFYVVSLASQERPELFLPYWDAVAALLHHPNSYHRDFALTILPNLLPVDHENRFAAVYREYFEHVHDPKFMTARCCIQNSPKIIQNRPKLKDLIIDLLLDVDRWCAYPENQKGLLKCDILDVLDEVNEVTCSKAIAFITACAGCKSPKTRRRAKEMIARYGL